MKSFDEQNLFRFALALLKDAEKRGWSCPPRSFMKLAGKIEAIASLINMLGGDDRGLAIIASDIERAVMPLPPGSDAYPEVKEILRGAIKQIGGEDSDFDRIYD